MSLAEIKTVYSIQSKNKSNPITQHCNTEAFIKKKKKPNTEQKRNKIQSKKETPNPEQTKPTVAPPLLAGAARSVTSAAPRLVVVPRSPVVVARRPPSSLVARRRRSSLARRRLPVVADQNGLTISAVLVLGQSASRYFSPFFSLTLSLSLSLSLSLKWKPWNDEMKKSLMPLSLFILVFKSLTVFLSLLN